MVFFLLCHPSPGKSRISIAMCLPAPTPHALDWLPSSAFPVMAPPGKSRTTPSCPSTSARSSQGTSHAIKRAAQAPQCFAAATGRVQLEETR
eukprot:4273009-Pyramimonas_sp.AAC.1